MSSVPAPDYFRRLLKCILMCQHAFPPGFKRVKDIVTGDIDSWKWLIVYEWGNTLY